MIEKQGKQALYENILWSRPQRRTGRILLMGGHRDGFAELQKTFTEFDAAGIAEVRLALPDKLSKLVGNLLGVSLVPSTPSGSIARDALAELVHLASQADAVCLGPDLSNNSETTLTMERLADETPSAIIIPPQSTEQFINQLPKWKDNENLLIFLSQGQVLKLAARLAVDASIPLNITIDALSTLAESISLSYKPSMVTASQDHIIVAVDGKVSITQSSLNVGTMATFWLQESKKYEALTTAAFVINGAAGGDRTHTL